MDESPSGATCGGLVLLRPYIQCRLLGALVSSCERCTTALVPCIAARSRSACLFVWTAGASFRLKGYARQERMACSLLWRPLASVGPVTFLFRHETVMRAFRKHAFGGRIVNLGCFRILSVLSACRAGPVRPLYSKLPSTAFLL